MYLNISSVVEFQRWWVLKSKIFGQESKYLKELKEFAHNFRKQGGSKIDAMQKIMLLQKNCLLN